VEKFPDLGAKIHQAIDNISTLLKFFFARLAWVSAVCEMINPDIVIYL
jgi:hypothetical protein